MVVIIVDSDGCIGNGPVEQHGLAVGDLLAETTDPTSLKEALADEDGDLYRKATAKEYDSLFEKNVLTLEDRPKD